MKHRKRAAIASALVLGTATAASAAQVDTWFKDGAANISIDFKACTSDKHLLTLSAGIEADVKSHVDYDNFAVKLNEFKTQFNRGLGVTISDIGALLVGSMTAEEIKSRASTLSPGAVVTQVTPETEAKLEALRPVLMGQMAEFDELGGAVASQIEEPHGVSFKASLSPKPSLDCK